MRIIATSAVVARIHKVDQEKLDKWKKLLGSGATTRVVPIEEFDGDTITFESSQIEVLEHKQAKDSESFIEAVKKRFPSADLFLAIERGAKANVRP